MYGVAEMALVRMDGKQNNCSQYAGEKTLNTWQNMLELFDFDVNPLLLRRMGFLYLLCIVCFLFWCYCWSLSLADFLFE